VKSNGVRSCSANRDEQDPRNLLGERQKHLQRNETWSPAREQRGLGGRKPAAMTGGPAEGKKIFGHPKSSARITPSAVSADVARW